ncbi:hypothetical protein AB4Z39_26495, partial [Mycobacterium adipatum]|uniref:hypothetical protein n=1 Tax=Mycobacterium adipatum TaxID=1682113 RepID=UPI0034E07F97
AATVRVGYRCGATSFVSVGGSGFAVGHVSILLYCSVFRLLRLGFASPVLVANAFRPAVVLWGGCWLVVASMRVGLRPCCCYPLAHSVFQF